MAQSVTRCSACRRAILDTVTAITGVSIRPLSLSTSRTCTSRTRIPLYRAFSLSNSFRESSSSRAAQQTPQQNAQSEDLSESSSAAPTTIPWYLQVQTPEPPAPISRTQAIEEVPPIPPDAPEILHPILTHLSTQIGLDNLALLDLRSVYPPPALGSNLLMILGTARSYKHLNTSADRFCRWLRSNYKLAPYADGLLGRNELKLKLRRKARRMKLAQSVGNTVAMGAVEGGDDGITTGWVCVNVGPVDNVEVEGDDTAGAGDRSTISPRAQEELDQDEEEYKNPPDDSGVIGFGTQDTRSRIVVQMFLEEKRIEMDLEGLWDFRVQRRERKEEKLDQEGMTSRS